MVKKNKAKDKSNEKPSSSNREISRMRLINNEFESKVLKEIATWQIEKYKAKRKKEIKPASENREIALLKRMFTKATEWGKLKDDPAKKVKLPKGKVLLSVGNH